MGTVESEPDAPFAPLSSNPRDVARRPRGCSPLPGLHPAPAAVRPGGARPRARGSPSLSRCQAVLTQSRERVSEELARLQKDNDSLQGKHSLHASLQQAENFILPDTIEVTRPPPCGHRARTF